MNNYLKNHTLGSLCKVINGRAYRQEELLDKGKYKVLRVGNFFSNNSWYYSDLELDTDKYCEEDDLLFAWSASFGPKIWKEPKVIYHYHIWKLLPNEELVLRKYLYYYLLNRTNSLMGSTHGSIMLHITKSFMESMSISLPNTIDQQKIASVLSALDDKIELNNKINAELETMAKTLYDYWFVQFDFPNAEGKPYKASGGEMVYDEVLKREIPKGWERGVASDLFQFNPSLSLAKGKVASYIDMSALPTNGFMTGDIQRKPFSGGMKFQNGDVLVARITPCLENGKTGLVSLLVDTEVGFGSTEFIVVRGRNKPLSCFASMLCRSEDFRKFAISNMIGTSGRKRVDYKTLEKYPLPIPNEELLIRFELKLKSSFGMLTKNAKENQELASLRDWLLPMLMNGQVKVREAYKEVEEKLAMVAEGEEVYDKNH